MFHGKQHVYIYTPTSERQMKPPGAKRHGSTVTSVLVTSLRMEFRVCLKSSAETDIVALLVLRTKKKISNKFRSCPFPIQVREAINDKKQQN